MWCSYAPAPMKESARPSCAARSAISRPISISLRASGMPVRAFARSSAGISSNRSSSRRAPMASSIARVSAAVCGMNGMAVRSWLLLVRFARELLFVRAGGEERVELGGVGKPDAHEPSGPVGVLVDELGRLREGRVPLDHFAGYRRVHVRCRLDGFDHGTGVARRHLAARFRHLDE